MQVTYSFKIKLGDQVAWDQLISMVLECGSIDECAFPKKASKKPEEWKELYMLSGEQVIEIAERLPDLWMSDMQGNTEISIEVKDCDGNQIS